MKKATIFLLFIIVGVFLRMWHLNIPLLEFNPSRQIQTAEITRNLYREGFNILAPNVRYLGPGPNLFLVEFPLYNLGVALLYYIFGVHEYLGRIFSILGWILSSFFLWKIASKYVGRFVANVALFFYTFSPLSVLVSRSFQPDQLMLMSSLAAVYFLDRWHRGQQLLFYLSATFASLALLLKIPAVIFTLIPATFIIIGKNVKLISPKSISFWAIALLPSLIWYLYATLVGRQGEVLTTASNISNWFGFEIFLNPKYYANIFGFEYNLVLLPTGIVLFMIGVLTKLKKDQQFLYFWLGSVILYFLIFNKHNMTHEYYHLPFLPIAAIFIGIGAERIIKLTNNLILPRNLLLVAYCLLFLIIMLPPTLARAYKPIDRFSHVTKTAQAIKQVTKPDDLIIGSMDAGPSLVYYSDRTGWGFDVNPKKIQAHRKFIGLVDTTVPDPIDKLEELRSRGAVLFASSSKPQLLTNKEFTQYLYSNYPILAETDNYIIFDLKSR